MELITKIIQRVQRFVHKQISKQGFAFDDAPDVRQPSKVEHSMSSIIHTAIFGLMSNQQTLRDVEEMTYSLNDTSRALIPKPISDTTINIELRRMDHYSTRRV